jgi:hypothetical protein
MKRPHTDQNPILQLLNSSSTIMYPKTIIVLKRWKTTSMEDNFNGRRLPLKRTSMEDELNSWNLPNLLYNICMSTLVRPDQFSKCWKEWRQTLGKMS